MDFMEIVFILLIFICLIFVLCVFICFILNFLSFRNNRKEENTEKRPLDFEWLKKLPDEEREQYGDFIVKVSLKRNRDYSNLLKQEGIDRQRKERFFIQVYYIDIVCGDKIKIWAKKEYNINLYKINCFPIYGGSVDMTIFYNTNEELRTYNANGTSEKIKTQFLKYLEEAGYYNYFPNEDDLRHDPNIQAEGPIETEKLDTLKKDYDRTKLVRMEFDSYERIKKLYYGNCEMKYYYD
jgi:hypothetical protein